MAATFQPVNTGATNNGGSMTTSTSATPTPRLDMSEHTHGPNGPDDSKTPTRATFDSAGQAAGVAASASSQTSNSPRRENSRRSGESSRDSMDMEMDDSDGEGAAAGEDGGLSDVESVGADGTKSKKKKSQRFYCTDYPPCNLSFTRSEHLARHIRKHTGERPFQCHCSRRFSRLDNLRQHAQTVHVNEDIPIDSLAATGSRFQRTMRPTDRVRQAGNRARASTSGSAGGPPRGHSKSLSTSSITSIGSVGSGYGMPQDSRRRPPPLVMANDGRGRASLESYRSGADSTYSYRPPSPGDFSTPTSATFSTAQSSPRWIGDLASPTSAHSRTHSMYSNASHTPSRRLSVPSGANPFQPGPGRPMFGPGHLNSSHPAAMAPANASPTASSSGWSTRRDSVSSNGDDSWRRRTWHPDSRNQPSNQLSAVNETTGPNPPPPIAAPATSQSNFRLPGIESFDPIPRQPATPPNRYPSPMVVDSDPSGRRPYQPGLVEAVQPDDRRNLNMYDASLQRGLTRLDISHKTPPGDTAASWASEANRAMQAQAEQVQGGPTVRFEDQVPPSRQHAAAVNAGRSLHQHTMSAPGGPTPRENKRHGWYQGPVRQEERPHVDRMEHPNLNGFNGFPGREQPQQQQPSQEGGNGDNLRRLEALVAVATSEGSTATAY